MVVGTQTYIITPRLMSYSTNESVGLADITPLSQQQTEQVVVSSDMSFDLTMFDAGEVFALSFEAGTIGILGIWKEGKAVGSRYTVLEVIIESNDLDAPNKEKLEVSISGTRNGPYFVSPNSIY